MEYRPDKLAQLAQDKGTHVLLETMAICQDKGARASEARHVPACCHISSHKPERPLASGPNTGHTDRHDQSMAQGSGASVCQRAVGEHSLPDYSPVNSVNRPVRTRMRGGAGAGGLKPPATRLGVASIVHYFLQTSRNP